MIRRRALTLLEVIISITLIALLMGAMFLFYWNMLEARQKSAEMANRTQLARNVLSRIEAEIRGTVGFEQVGFSSAGESRLSGERRKLTFLSSALPESDRYYFPGANDKPPPGEHDLRLLSYSLWIDPENKTEEDEPIVGGIIRTEKRTLNQYVVDEEDPLEIRNDLWSPELTYLEFRYFDGVEWDTVWDVTDGNSLPQLIMVTVGYKPVTTDELEDADLELFPLAEYPFGDPAPRADRYSTIIRLPAADRFFGSRISRVGKQYSEQLGVLGDSLK